MHEVYSYSTVLLVIASINFDQFSEYVFVKNLIFLSGLNLHFPIHEWCVHFFMCVVIIWISFSLDCLSSYELLRILYIFWIQVFCQKVLAIFCTVCGLPFHWLTGILQRTEVLNFYEVQFINFILRTLCFLCPTHDISAYPVVKKISS